MNAYEGIYDQPKFGEALTRIVFDPYFLPIRSCLRPEDELQSCYGPVQRKSVGFSNYSEVYNYDRAEEFYVDMTGPNKLPPPQRSESHMRAYENLFVDPKSSGLQPNPSILKRGGAPSREKKSVHFSLLQENLTPVGEITKTFVAFDPLPDCWKANFIFDTGAYWLNCNLCR